MDAVTSDRLTPRDIANFALVLLTLALQGGAIYCMPALGIPLAIVFWIPTLYHLRSKQGRVGDDGFKISTGWPFLLLLPTVGLDIYFHPWAGILVTIFWWQLTREQPKITE